MATELATATDEVRIESKLSFRQGIYNIPDPQIKENARKLRKTMTKEERHLWYDFLKNLPCKIHRQRIFGNYIVDFYCASAKTVIEIDGSQHYEDEGIHQDNIRDSYLNSLGIQVLRYSNKDINFRFEEVCEDLYNKLVLEKNRL